jgi:hypothetical protein
VIRAYGPGPALPGWLMRQPLPLKSSVDEIRIRRAGGWPPEFVTFLP